MAGPQHRTPEYRAARRRLERQVNREGGQCAQPVCLMPSRRIEIGAPFDTAHDESGTVILGPSHPGCNRSDGGKRRHQDTGPARWTL